MLGTFWALNTRQIFGTLDMMSVLGDTLDSIFINFDVLTDEKLIKS